MEDCAIISKFAQSHLRERPSIILRGDMGTIGADAFVKTRQRIFKRYPRVTDHAVLPLNRLAAQRAAALEIDIRLFTATWALEHRPRFAAVFHPNIGIRFQRTFDRL